MSFRSHHPGWRGAGWWEGAPLPGGGQQSTLCVPVLMKSDTAKAPGVVCQLQTQRALPNPSSLSALPYPPTASSIPLLISLPAQLTDTNAQPSFSKAWTGQALCLFSVDLPKAGHFWPHRCRQDVNPEGETDVKWTYLYRSHSPDVPSISSANCRTLPAGRTPGHARGRSPRVGSEVRDGVDAQKDPPSRAGAEAQVSVRTSAATCAAPD